MVERNVGNWQNLEIKVSCRRAYILCTQGTWQRFKALCGLQRAKQDHGS
jgi:hypothetical protein